jgi:uncharacterized protein YegP (UPF0339 family)
MAAKFDLKQDSSGKFLFHLLAPGGEVILESRLFDSKAAAQNAVGQTRASAIRDASFERVTSEGSARFVLKDPRGATLGRSPAHPDLEAVERAIRSAMEHAPRALLVDHARPPRNKGANANGR